MLETIKYVLGKTNGPSRTNTRKKKRKGKRASKGENRTGGICIHPGDVVKSAIDQALYSDNTREEQTHKGQGGEVDPGTNKQRRKRGPSDRPRQ